MGQRAGRLREGLKPGDLPSAALKRRPAHRRPSLSRRSRRDPSLQAAGSPAAPPRAGIEVAAPAAPRLSVRGSRSRSTRSTSCPAGLRIGLRDIRRALLQGCGHCLARRRLGEQPREDGVECTSAQPPARRRPDATSIVVALPVMPGIPTPQPEFQACRQPASIIATGGAGARRRRHRAGHQPETNSAGASVKPYWKGNPGAVVGPDTVLECPPFSEAIVVPASTARTPPFAAQAPRRRQDCFCATTRPVALTNTR